MMNWREWLDSLALVMAMVCFHSLMKTIDVVAPALPLLWHHNQWHLMWDGLSLVIGLILVLVWCVWVITKRMDK
ncbi:hypothetical protein ADP71_31580 [Vitreoscilla sp. C1]|uniref:hypothetical protein n=1 Tax=Vitreoscilla sp. (strain C1) TaxID=96942 RepID=UPI000CDCBB28|nr:hypothetical protein [Vitreoscilla sp. C1]AUZ06336.1 hypothetical protein ADP71_31580 [Vitreoscilla sp. C1]